MAVPGGTFQTYPAVGNREDLSDMIYRVDPTETPFVSAIDKEKSSAVKHEWQTQGLAAADSANAQIEGNDFVSNAVTATVRLDNQHQISTKKRSVAGTQRAVDHAGRDDELAYQDTLKALELKLDIEKITVGTNQAKDSGASTTARKTASVLSWIGNNDVFDSTSGGSPATADGAATRTDGNMRAFDENLLKSALLLAYNAGGKPDTIMVGGFNKQQFSTFTGRSTPMEQASTKGIVASVDWYQGDFTRAKVVANRQMRGRDCLILQTDMWALAHLPGRNMAAFDVAKTGDADQRAVLSEYCLVSRNEKASAGVFDLTSS